MVTEVQETQVAEVAPHQVVKTTKVVHPDVVGEQPQKVFAQKKTIFRFYQIIWYILGVIETLLLLRFVLKMIGANPFSGFVSFVYAVSDPFALPFQGIVPSVVSGVNVIEWSTIIAAVVYFLLAYGIIELFQFIKPVSPHEVEEAVDDKV